MRDTVDIYVQVHPDRPVNPPRATDTRIRSKSVAEMVYLDYDQDGELLGVEILNVPRGGLRVNGEEVPR